MTDQSDRAYARLRKFCEDHIHGGCKILSLGDACTCLLCDLDRLRAAALARERATQVRVLERPPMDLSAAPAPAAPDELVERLVAIADRITCYASTTDYAPNADAKDIREAAARIEADAKRIAELERERDELREAFDVERNCYNSVVAERNAAEDDLAAARTSIDRRAKQYNELAEKHDAARAVIAAADAMRADLPYGDCRTYYEAAYDAARAKMEERK